MDSASNCDENILPEFKLMTEYDFLFIPSDIEINFLERVLERAIVLLWTT
jgi:hypothetical protein